MNGLELAVLLVAIGSVIQGGKRPQERGAGGVVREFRGRRAVSRYTQTIEAAPDRVFPLLCPIREAEWAEGWVAHVVYAASGVAEADGVYATEHEGERDKTIWVVTRHDLRTHEIELVYFVPGLRVTKLTMAVSSRPLGGSSVTITYTNTGLSEKGNAEIAAQFEDEAAFEQRMVEWQAAMNHYLKTGRMLKHAR